MTVHIEFCGLDLLAHGDYSVEQEQTMTDPPFDSYFEVTSIYAYGDHTDLTPLLEDRWTEIEELACEAFEDMVRGEVDHHAELDREERRGA